MPSMDISKQFVTLSFESFHVLGFMGGSYVNSLGLVKPNLLLQSFQEILANLLRWSGLLQCLKIIQMTFLAFMSECPYNRKKNTFTFLMVENGPFGGMVNQHGGLAQLKRCQRILEVLTFLDIVCLLNFLAGDQVILLITLIYMK